MKKVLLVFLVLFMVTGLLAQQGSTYTFRVDMTVQKLKGVFDPSNDAVTIRGLADVNRGWAQYTDPAGSWQPGLEMQRDINTPADQYIYVIDVTVPDSIFGDTIAYKYAIEKGGMIPEQGNEVWESLSLAPTEEVYENNRYFVAAAGDPVVEDLFSYETADDILLSDLEVLITVDMRPAFYLLADSGKIPSSYIGAGPDAEKDLLSIDSVYIAGGANNSTPELYWVHDVTNEPSKYQPLEMFDDGTNGDEVAGDSIYSIKITFHAGASKTGECKFSINLNDVEGGFAKNHIYDLSSLPNRLDFVFGTNDPDRWRPYIDWLGIENDNNTITSFDLKQNYPNPFNPTTSIEFTLERPANVELAVFNSLGQKVKTLVNGFVANSKNVVEWDGTNEAGQVVPSGIYFYTLKVGNHSKTMKMVMMK